jgi:F0F1-type ATP synthase membrane subunit b/b'
MPPRLSRSVRNPSQRPTRGTTRRAELTETYRHTAREYRTKRVKEARDEAKKEIEQYRGSKEEEFKKFEAEVRTQT